MRNKKPPFEITNADVRELLGIYLPLGSCARAKKGDCFVGTVSFFQH